MRRCWRASTLAVLAATVMGVLPACGPPPGRTGASTEVVYTEKERREASDEYQRLITRMAEGNWSEARELTRNLVARYPGFGQEDHALLLGAQAARKLRDDRTAREWLTRLTGSHPNSSYVGEGWWELANLYEDRGEWLDAAVAYIEAHGAIRDRTRQEEIHGRLRHIVDEQLSLDELQELASRYPEEGVGGYVSFLAVQRRFEAGEDASSIGPALEDFLRAYPDSRYTEPAQQMLAELRRRTGYELPPELSIVVPEQIGILCPLTGEYAALGQAMYDGGILALEEHSRATGDDLRLISLDTQGDGVRAVQAARRLIDEEGVLAIVGALLSPTTIAVATLCEERGVPLVSPTATQETISELGRHVFQTNLTGDLEIRLVAQVGVNVLLKRRYAILYPRTEEGTRAADLFAEQVEGLGARVVASEGFERGVTDFKDIIERIRSAGPEALFIPAPPSEMRLIAPQLTFYDLETQLLGPSSWNNSLLGREVGEYLDRAIFPTDMALIPEAERARFEELWQRRYPSTSSSPFALKTYFAVRSVLEAIHEGIRSREDLQAYLEQQLSFGGETGARLGMEKLRMLEDGQAEAFPVALFPRSAAEPELPVLFFPFGN
jgi:branched-chain amino acid transport system substrate-binding protein